MSSYKVSEYAIQRNQENNKSSLQQELNESINTCLNQFSSKIKGLTERNKTKLDEIGLKKDR